MTAQGFEHAAKGSLSGPQTICLSMIVRNENGPHLRRCFESVRPFISSWAIVDTGSTDGTQDTIRSLLADIPGQLIEREWVDDFSNSRNQALTLAEESCAGFAMVLDADDYIIARQEPPPSLQPFLNDVVSLPGLDDGKMLLLATFIRLNTGLRFHGRVHELVVRPDGTLPTGVSDPSYFTWRTRDGSASTDGGAKQAYYRNLLLRSVEEDESDSFAWEALSRDAIANGDIRSARIYLESAIAHVPLVDKHRRYTLRLSRISTFAPFLSHLSQIAEEIDRLIHLCPERAEAPRWIARELRRAELTKLADQFDAGADEIAMPTGVYGVDPGSYKQVHCDNLR